jgi:alpha-ketoglutarate-dependent taurine dioxygenase
MRVQVVAAAASLGAEICGVDLRHLQGSAFAEIESAFNEHGVLLFRDQHLTREEQVNFARRFGPLESYSAEPSYSAVRIPEGAPVVVDIANVDLAGIQITDRQHPSMRQIAGNERWHADSSFRPRGSKASVLAALEVTLVGGETEFADMRAAYDALPTDDKAAVGPLHAWHSLNYSQALAGAGDVEPASDPTTMSGAWQPVVRWHPVTGRPSLCIGRHACQIYGMEVGDAQRLLQDLLDGACRPPRVLTHRWTVGDVVIWDNRCVLHRVRPWDLTERRVMRHVRIAGEWEPDHPA